jgi:hypothetical protein
VSFCYYIDKNVKMGYYKADSGNYAIFERGEEYGSS